MSCLHMLKFPYSSTGLFIRADNEWVEINLLWYGSRWKSLAFIPLYFIVPCKKRIWCICFYPYAPSKTHLKSLCFISSSTYRTHSSIMPTCASESRFTDDVSIQLFLVLMFHTYMPYTPLPSIHIHRHFHRRNQWRIYLSRSTNLFDTMDILYEHLWKQHFIMFRW